MEKNLILPIAERLYQVFPYSKERKMLLFEYLPSLAGLEYKILENSVVSSFAKSTFLVRDRQLLSKSREWESVKQSFFESNFLVSCEDCCFFCNPEVWAPSVDAVILLNALKKEKEFFGFHSVLDLGCGSGVMALCLSKIFQNLEKIVCVDINPLAHISLSVNYYINRFSKDLSFFNKVSEYKGTCDTTIATPYYFPVFKTSAISCDKQLQDSIDSTIFLIQSAVNFAKKAAYFIYSSTTEKEIRSGLNFNWDVIDEVRVPFTIGDNVGNKHIVNTAIKKGMLLNGSTEQFPYDHLIYVGKFTK